MVKIMDLVTDEDRRRWKEEGRELAREELRAEREVAAQRARLIIRDALEFRFGFIPESINEVLEATSDDDALWLLVEHAGCRAQSLEEILLRADELLG